MSRRSLKVTFIAATPEKSAEARVIRNCARDLARDGGEVLFLERKTSRAKWWKEAIKAFSTSDVIIFHSPLVLSAPLVLLARILGRRIVSLVWDVYPVRLSGKRYDGRAVRRVADRLERLCLSISHVILVPSPDFLKEPSLARAAFLPMWTSSERAVCGSGAKPALPNAVDGTRLQILFAGQVNQTRDLEGAIKKLTEGLQVPFVLKIASFSEVPAKLRSHPSVNFVGGLTSAELQKLSAECHFGLISLSPQLDGAGFPSKTFDYLAFGLPILYFGPRLEYFIGLIEATGVGVDITDMREIPSSRLREVSEALEHGRERFISAATLSPGTLIEVLSRCGCES